LVDAFGNDISIDTFIEKFYDDSHDDDGDQIKLNFFTKLQYIFFKNDSKDHKGSAHKGQIKTVITAKIDNDIEKCKEIKDNMSISLQCVHFL
jgi:hypothetical protein